MGQTLGDVQWDALLKELYPDGLPAEIMMRKHVLLSKVKKDGDAYGEYMVIPVVYDNPAGRSANVSLLLGGVSESASPIGPTKSVKFLPALASDYAATWINELTIRKAANDRGAFVNARKFEVDGLLRQLGNSLAHALYRAGDGTTGQGNGSWTITGNVVTLATRADAKFFGLGMHIDFIAATGAAVGGAPTGAARGLAAANLRGVVTKVDEDLGQITIGARADGAAITDLSGAYTALANTDWLAPAGDYNQNWATTGAVKIRGLAAWIPLTAPSASESFWGVDRSVHPTRLAGSRLNEPSAPAEDSIMALAELMHERGANPDIVLVSPRQFTKISKRLNAKVEYEGAGGDAKYGFMTFGIATSAGVLPVFADPDCPEDRGYILTTDTWRIKHLGLPEIVATDGNSALRRQYADAIEIRCRYYAQLVCYAPGENGVFAVS
jgi:hypothetical protein